jgi:NADH-quinone oxidoreductase subunit L
METAAVLIPLFPFAGFLLNGLLGRRMGKGFVATIACAGPIFSFFCALAILVHLLRGAPYVEATIYTWIGTDDLTVPFRLVVDPLSVLMCLVVTGIGSLIHIYSTEYMEHEARGGYARYFAYLNLFTSLMLLLVTGASLPLMFVGWEGVGLASYLLIGFWYQNDAYASAGKKAFIVNRIGDFGFLIGIFTLFAAFRTLGMSDLNELASRAPLAGSSVLTTAAVCLFLGACGKSAQIPLYVWLPDAMAGPTPVSALIHAATMVTAGVYMVLRLHGVFVHAPGALALVATVGCATAFFAATMALAENDLKKVLAYSTVSQLGYMFVGVGTGAFTAGFFHVFTHAFFKALLFLGAGVVMHALDGATDLRKMGGLREKLPLTFWLFLAGALALAGLPPFAGFFSKDEILWSALASWSDGRGAGWLVIWIVCVVTAGITAFYTFRAFSLAFLGEPRGPADTHMHAHEPGWPMLAPLVVLAAGACLAGLLNIPDLFLPHAERVSEFLEPVFGEHVPAPHTAAFKWLGAAIPTGLAILCAVAAWRIYQAGPDALAEVTEKPVVKPLYELMARKYGVDAFYDRAIVQQVKAGAASLWEYVDVALIDNTVNGIASLAKLLAERARRLEPGVVNLYAFYVAGGAAAILYFALRAH